MSDDVSQDYALTLRNRQQASDDSLWQQMLAGREAPCARRLIMASTSQR